MDLTTLEKIDRLMKEMNPFIIFRIKWDHFETLLYLVVESFCYMTDGELHYRRVQTTLCNIIHCQSTLLL